MSQTEQEEYERLVKVKSTMVLETRLKCALKMVANLEAEYKRVKKLRNRLEQSDGLELVLTEANAKFDSEIS